MTDPARLAALRQVGLLDTPPEAAFDRLARLASRLLRAPAAMVSLVDAERQFFKAAVGLREPWASRRETPLSHSFCRHCVALREPFVVDDARVHPLVRDNPGIDALGMVAYAGIPLTMSDGHVLGALCAVDDAPREWTPDEIDTLRDLAAAVVTEIELRAKVDLLRFQATLLDTVQEAVIATWPDGHVRYWNRCAERMYGYSAADAVGQPIGRLIGLSVDANERAWETLRAGTTVAGDWDVRRRDGSIFPVHVTAAPVLDDAGAVVGIVGVSEDITERRELEAQLRQAQKMEAVGRLAGGVAHDFNNALGVIVGFGELLLDRSDLSLPVRHGLDEMMKSAERATSLTRQLLAFSRREVVSPRVVDARSLVADTESMLRRLIGEDIELRTELPTDPVHVRVDPGQVEQVLLNLAVNARDAMPRGGRLTVSLDRADLEAGPPRPPELEPGVYARLVVADTGHGMDAETLARAFEPFFTTKERGRGTGLGLATVYGIVQQNGGAIAAESAPGRGATFTILLPLTDEPCEDAAPAAPAPRGGAETVLLAEDEASLRHLSRSVLEAAGYRVLAATDGDHALKLAAEHPGRIDLLVTDVVMPGVGGGELALRLLERSPNTRVLFMSGYTDDAVVRHGVHHAEVAFLQKPASPRVLLAKVRELLGGPTP